MFKRPVLLRYLFVTLFTVCNVVMLLAAYTSPVKTRDSNWLFNIGTAPGYSSTSSYHKPLRVKNDHIRVRYMAADCGYDPSVFPLHIQPLGFNEDIATCEHSPFTFSRPHFSFKLRGPPALCILA